jgi:sugar lactone lactonase YvrE
MTTTTVPTLQVSATLRWYTSCPQPNGLQANEEGLWVIDQKDHPLMVMLLDWQTGRELRSFPTETNHSSGITVEPGPDGAIWVASTYPPIELFRYSRDGKVTRRLDTPGKSEKSGAHGLEWIDGTLWVTVPPSATTYQLDPETGRVLKRFPAPGNRPHGVAWDGTHLWVAETTERTITAYRLDGTPVRELALTSGPKEGPNPHGMTYWKGELWYCDADTRAVCTIRIPNTT